MCATSAKKPCPVSIRLPADILKLLELHAVKNGRSRNREIVSRLIASLTLENVYDADGAAGERRPEETDRQRRKR